MKLTQLTTIFNGSMPFIGFIFLLVVSSCKPEIKDLPLSPGEADFSKFIAVGNSLTAGFSDGGLYLEGQQVAFPNLLAQQFRQVGGGDFRSPFFTESEQNGSGYLQLKALVDGQPVMENVSDQLAYREEGKLTKHIENIDNLGVPGMRLDLSTQGWVSGLNMYFERLLPDAEVGTKTYMQFATGREHTFFSFWLGNNDVLGYATNGAVTDAADPSTVLTDVELFEQLYNNFVAVLSNKGQKGVLATIPDVTAIPFFTTVTRTSLLEAVQATGANAAEIYITDVHATPRAATDADLFVLPFASSGLLGSTTETHPAPYGLHISNPIDSRYVLDRDEVTTVRTRVKAFNSIIKRAADTHKLAVADVYAYLNEVKDSGIVSNGVAINADFITGNVFSLDGIHLTPMGNALMTNLFIDAINKQYNSKVPKADVSNYRAVKFP